MREERGTCLLDEGDEVVGDTVGGLTDLTTRNEQQVRGHTKDEHRRGWSNGGGWRPRCCRPCSCRRGSAPSCTWSGRRGWWCPRDDGESEHIRDRRWTPRWGGRERHRRRWRRRRRLGIIRLGSAYRWPCSCTCSWCWGGWRCRRGCCCSRGGAWQQTHRHSWGRRSGWRRRRDRVCWRGSQCPRGWGGRPRDRVETGSHTTTSWRRSSPAPESFLRASKHLGLEKRKERDNGGGEWRGGGRTLSCRGYRRGWPCIRSQEGQKRCGNQCNRFHLRKGFVGGGVSIPVKRMCWTMFCVKGSKLERDRNKKRKEPSRNKLMKGASLSPKSTADWLGKWKLTVKGKQFKTDEEGILGVLKGSGVSELNIGMESGWEIGMELLG